MKNGCLSDDYVQFAEKTDQEVQEFIKSLLKGKRTLAMVDISMIVQHQSRKNVFSYPFGWANFHFWDFLAQIAIEKGAFKCRNKPKIFF